MLVVVLMFTSIAAQQVQNPRQQPGAMVHTFASEQHDLYDGRFVISVNRIYMVGGLNAPEGWDHIANEAKNRRRPENVGNHILTEALRKTFEAHTAPRAGRLDTDLRRQLRAGLSLARFSRTGWYRRSTGTTKPLCDRAFGSRPTRGRGSGAPGSGAAATRRMAGE